ncbi:MAG: phosphatase PAP2 family protein [Rhodocyclaceae bacterium]|nr:phosphatase PAP2 family protein [Rhodocyclaceae bacterium]
MARLSAPLVFVVAVGAFWLWPELDLSFSRLFYRSGEGFVYANAPWVQTLYHLSPWLVNAATAVLIALLFASLTQRWRPLRRPAAFVLAVLWLGPGLIVTVLKDHWDRARPAQIVEFGGSLRFTPAWAISDQCEDNCSFVSGHASGAFSLMALAWVFPRRRRLWLIAGTGWGALVGLARIAQGGHFLSDVVFAGFIVYFTASLLAPWMLREKSSSCQQGRMRL